MMNQYAPQYTLVEKAWRIIPALAFFLPLAWFTQSYFFPWFEAFAEVSICFDFLGYRGDNYLLWFLVAIPVLTAAFIFLLYAKILTKSWKQEQFPPEGYKVYNKTRYQFGTKAKLKVIAVIAVNLGIMATAGYSFSMLDPLFGEPVSNLQALCQDAVMPKFFPATNP